MNLRLFRYWVFYLVRLARPSSGIHGVVPLASIESCERADGEGTLGIFGSQWKKGEAERLNLKPEEMCRSVESARAEV